MGYSPGGHKESDMTEHKKKEEKKTLLLSLELATVIIVKIISLDIRQFNISSWVYTIQFIHINQYRYFSTSGFF